MGGTQPRTGGAAAHAQGAGLFVGSGTVNISSTNDTFAGNEASGGFGGSGVKYGAGGACQGVALYAPSATLTLSGDTFRSNHGSAGTGLGSAAVGQGGGVYVGGGSLTLGGTTFQSNKVVGGLESNGAGQGGGLYAAGSSLTLTDKGGNQYLNNVAVGGSVPLTGTVGNNGQGGGLYANVSTLTLTGDTFTGNMARAARRRSPRPQARPGRWAVRCRWNRDPDQCALHR